jgi:hypothetical protein
LNGRPGASGVILKGRTGRTANLCTDRTFGDIELYLEFMLAKGSNSGVYLQGLYEVQIFDSFGTTDAMKTSDGGAVVYDDCSTNTKNLRAPIGEDRKGNRMAIKLNDKVFTHVNNVKVELCEEPTGPCITKNQLRVSKRPGCRNQALLGDAVCVWGACSPHDEATGQPMYGPAAVDVI